MGIKGDVIAVAVAGTVLLVAGLYAKKKLGQAAAVVGPALNPADPRNLAYSGVNAIGGALTGTSDFSLGGWFYDITHPAKSPQEVYQIPTDFGIVNPNLGWEDDYDLGGKNFGVVGGW